MNKIEKQVRDAYELWVKAMVVKWLDVRSVPFSREQPDWVYIGRRKGKPTMWGNPFEIGKHGTRDEVLEKYEVYYWSSGLDKYVHELRGWKLACFCAPKKCHGHFLVKQANPFELWLDTLPFEIERGVRPNGWTDEERREYYESLSL